MTPANFPINSARSLAQALQVVDAALHPLSDDGALLYPGTAIAYVLSDMFPDIAHKEDLSILVVGSEREARWAAATVDALLGRATAVRVMYSRAAHARTGTLTDAEHAVLPAVVTFVGEPGLAPVDLVFLVDPDIQDPRRHADGSTPHAWISEAASRGVRVAGSHPTMFEADLYVDSVEAMGGGRAMQLVVPTFARSTGASAPAQELGRHLFGFGEAETKGGTQAPPLLRTMLGEAHESMLATMRQFGGVPTAVGKIVSVGDFEDIVVGLEGTGYCMARCALVALKFDVSGESVLDASVTTGLMTRIKDEDVVASSAAKRAAFVGFVRNLALAAGGVGEPPDGWVKFVLADAHAEEEQQPGFAPADHPFPPHPLSFDDQTYPFLKALRLPGAGKVYGEVRVVECDDRMTHDASVYWYLGDGTPVAQISLEALRPEDVLTDKAEDLDTLAHWAAALLGPSKTFDKRTMQKWAVEYQPTVVVRAFGASIEQQFDQPGNLKTLLLEGLRGISTLLSRWGEQRVAFTAQHEDPFCESDAPESARAATEQDLVDAGFVKANAIRQSLVDRLSTRDTVQSYPTREHASVYVVPSDLVPPHPESEIFGLDRGELRMCAHRAVTLPSFGPATVRVALARHDDKNPHGQPRYIAAVQWTDNDDATFARASVALIPTDGDLASAARNSGLERELSTVAERSGRDVVMSRRAAATWLRLTPDVLGILMDMDADAVPASDLPEFVLESLRVVSDVVSEQTSGRHATSFLLYAMVGDSGEPAPEIVALRRDLGLVEAGPCMPTLFDLQPEADLPELIDPLHLVPADAFTQNDSAERTWH